MDTEATKCRAPLAAELNKLGVWLPFPNVSYLIKADAYRGRPDGEYRTRDGRIIDVEFKAHAGSVYLGNPQDPADTSGWHAAQRSWWRHVSRERSCVPYLLAIWTYPEAGASRFDSKKQRFFLPTPEEYLAVEQKVLEVDTGRRTIAVAAGSDRILKHRHLSMESELAHCMFATPQEAALYIDRKAQ